MTDIAAWLEQLGLTKYAPIFSENEVELADLSELSEDDLKEIQTVSAQATESNP